jgi:hypothetical protein
MELHKKEQSRGPFHKLKSSFNEIFGKPEPTPSQEVNRPREETATTTYEKTTQ